MKRAILFLCLTLLTLSAPAQTWQWYNPAETPYPVIRNRGFAGELGNRYERLPPRAEALIRPDVWKLSRSSAGVAIAFRTDAPQIKIRYTTTNKSYGMNHMPATGVSGVDLYRRAANGGNEFCFGGYSFKDTVEYSYKNLKAPAGSSGGTTAETSAEAVYTAYLPLYNSVKWLEVGVPEGYSLSFEPAPDDKPIVLYGTSIAQGACASRPGMAWGTILQRRLDCPVVNLGFSGNGRLEPELIALIGELDARLYILDCIPNLTERTEEEIVPIVVSAVKQLRSLRDSPILLVEHAGHSNALTDTAMLPRYEHANRASRRAFEILQREQVPGLYYLSHDELNFDPDAWVDHVHPSDIGMRRQAEAVETSIRKIPDCLPAHGKEK